MASVQTKRLNVSKGIQIPLVSAHLSAHNPSSVTDQLELKPLPELEVKVAELVQEHFLNQRSLKLSLKTWVDKELVPKHLEAGIITQRPTTYNRAYYPNAEDVRVMVQKAIAQECNSLFDQDAVIALLQSEEVKLGLKFYFRHFRKGDNKK